ncbi:MAG: hypothetical protein NC253_01405 [Ruminococcus sp.]|nr:hypothetical protein [Ruminococcus sp.]MCM1380918.1 hypothetical protein [Muribaculaceae bacterium]MCM1480364.1 hypothetical protein [Muribaculaceae bacterium]
MQERFANLQQLIGNLTIEQFTELIGVIVGCVFIFLAVDALICAVVDGWAFRKSALYYGSLHCLNKGFRNLKAAKSLQELDLVNAELRGVIRLLRCQRAVPKIMYKQLEQRREQIWQQRRSELFSDEYVFNY